MFVDHAHVSCTRRVLIWVFVDHAHVSDTRRVLIWVFVDHAHVSYTRRVLDMGVCGSRACVLTPGESGYGCLWITRMCLTPGEC